MRKVPTIISEPRLDTMSTIISTNRRVKLLDQGLGKPKQRAAPREVRRHRQPRRCIG